MRSIVDDVGAPVDTARFLAAVAAPHVALCRVDVYLNGEQLAVDVEVSAGNVTWDRSAAVRSRCSGVRVPAGVIIPELLPRGYEIRLWRGVELRATRAEAVQTDYLTDGTDYLTGDGELLIGDSTLLSVYGIDVAVSRAWCSLGVYAIQDCQIDDSSGKAVTVVSGDDLSRRVADAGLADHIHWTTADTLETVVASMIQVAVPHLTFRASGATHSAPLVTHELGADPWKICTEAAKAVGYEVFVTDFDVIWRPEPDLATSEPVATISDGNDGVWVEGTLAESLQGTFNEWPVTGSNGSNTAEFSATAVDDDPGSPSSRARIGRRPAPVERLEQVDSQAKADAASEGLKVANKGIVQTITVSTWPNPALEVGDAVTVSRTVLGVDTVALLDEVDMGLMPEDDMRLSVRSRVAV